jgi:hypothetical protein
VVMVDAASCVQCGNPLLNIRLAHPVARLAPSCFRCLAAQQQVRPIRSDPDPVALRLATTAFEESRAGGSTVTGALADATSAVETFHDLRRLLAAG